jgi:hypothetical protein
MLLNSDQPQQPIIRLPDHIFLLCIITALLGPFLARLPGVPMHGWEWFTDYLPGLSGLLFISAFNLIPGIVLYGIGKGSKRAPIAFWFATSAAIGFLLWAHGTVNVRSSSTASIALVFIPVYGVGAIVIGWVIGLLMHFLVRVERLRLWMVGIVGIVAVLIGVGLAVRDSITISQRESRFPVITINQLPLLKRTVYANKSVGEVEVLAFSNYDAEAGNEIGVLGRQGLALLQPDTYLVKSISAFAQDDCESCVHMYPYLVPDGKGNRFVTSSDGLSDRSGHLLWTLKASGFTRLVPVQLSDQTPTFFSYQNSERIDRHDIDGKVLWSVNLNVSDVGVYVTPEGKELPFALTCYGKSRELKLYDLDGKLQKTIALPEWASEVASVAWPIRGNLLVGSGSWIGVLDSQGKEVFRHTIQNTSFNPYHGPDGVSVRFDSTQASYLAVMSHGSSGYPRSVLLIFDPKGSLVWQEELNKLHSIIAVPVGNGKQEVLLVGGMDGIIEYKLKDITAPN